MTYCLIDPASNFIEATENSTTRVNATPGIYVQPKKSQSVKRSLHCHV